MSVSWVALVIYAALAVWGGWLIRVSSSAVAVTGRADKTDDTPLPGA